MHNIRKRFLIFPQAAPTRVQFIAGVGIPVDLEAETITTGAVLKGQFWLPYNATQLYYGLTAAGLPITRSTEKRKRGIFNPRLAAYKALEYILDNRGHNGVDCILRAICEAAQIPFSQFHPITELFHLFFT
ncbi:unnamed protein product [Hermetia illucens]|uniref:Uncharacterized protein n=1 Tax=Hermetia illucens TaxID=343691 RepID=A0A7R8YW89_HERIL|nr:unnamed protein product [Hermetia illucens]